MTDRQRLRARVRQGTTWYKITNLAGDGGPAEVAIYDEIGYWGITASDFLAELKAITASEINLRLNSPGGEIFDGIAIYNTLRSHTARVTVHVDSLAASIASVIAMAGDRIVMLSHSQLMIHDAMTVAVGNAGELREMAEMLDRQSDNIAGIYAERAGGTVKQWRSRMTAETWYSAAEAVEAGLADELVKPARQEEQDLAARWDLSVFAYAGRSAAPPPDLSRPPLADPSPPVPPAPEPVAPEVLDVVEPVTAPAPPDPEPVELVAIDPEVFRAAMHAAAGGFEFDADGFRQAMTSLAGDAPAVPAPTPEPEPVVVAPEPEPEPEQPGPGALLREVVATLTADAPAVPVAVAANPEPEPQPVPAPVVEPPDDPWLAMAELFHAGVELAAADAPSPTVTPAIEPEPELYDATVVQRALKEAVK